MTTLETIDPLDSAIAEHLDNPRKAVRRICFEHGVSKSTFYRKLKALGPQLSSKVAKERPPIMTVSTDNVPETNSLYRYDASIYTPRNNSTDQFYAAKFPYNGEVSDGWNATEWIISITGGWKSSTRGCYAVMQSTKRPQ